MIKIPKHKNNYSRTLSHELSKFCLWSYYDPTHVHNNVIHYKYHNIHHVVGNLTCGYIIELNNSTICAFHGVSNLKSLTKLFKLSPKPFGDIELNCGIVDEYIIIRDQMRRLINPKKNLLLTGHSMGGGIAALLALEYPEAITYTFGTPRFISKKTEHNAFSVINNMDVLAHLPTSVKTFTHFGEKQFLPKMDVCPLNIWNNHAITSYIKGTSNDLNYTYQLPEDY